MNILYVAYSCDPYAGSEDKIGWSVPFESARSNRVHVLTKEEQREPIERYLAAHPACDIRFHYVDIPPVCKRLLGESLYSGRLGIWNRRAYATAARICASEAIDLIHQVTPVEFRAIGDYGRIGNVPFVCGPVGGAEYIPPGLRGYAQGHEAQELVRRAANALSRWHLATSGVLGRVDHVLFANGETQDYLGDLCGGQDARPYPEIGVGEQELARRRRRRHDGCTILVAGRLVYRKGHDLLLDALAGLPADVRCECRIVGDGPCREALGRRCQGDARLRDRVVLTGAASFEGMTEEYQNADVLVMPSLRETSGSVVLEAMARGLPVITIGRFGGAEMVDAGVGWLYAGTDQGSYVRSLQEALIECIASPEERERRGGRARGRAEHYTWGTKVTHYQDIYDRLVPGERT